MEIKGHVSVSQLEEISCGFDPGRDECRQVHLAKTRYALMNTFPALNNDARRELVSDPTTAPNPADDGNDDNYSSLLW